MCYSSATGRKGRREEGKKGGREERRKGLKATHHNHKSRDAINRVSTFMDGPWLESHGNSI